MKNKRIILNWLLCLLPFYTLSAQDAHWQCNIRDYQYDMTVYAALQVDGIMLVASHEYEIAAFCGDECRGVASVETIGSTGKTYYYLRVRSNISNNETITFKCYDRTKQCELELDTTIDFESQGIKAYPSNPFVLTGAYRYKVEYIVDGEAVKTDSVKYGVTIILSEEPVKEGYTFSGWSEVPATMPAKDVTVSGTFTINQYAVTFVIDGEVFATDTITYGEKIILPDVPVKEGYDFAWNDEIPETMPAEDIVINGSYTSGVVGVELNEVVLYIYSIGGKRVDELRKGINIVLMSDGRIRKVMVK